MPNFRQEIELLQNYPKHKTFTYTTTGDSAATVLDLGANFEEVNKLKVHYEIGPRRDGDVEEIYSDNKKVDALLDWRAGQSIMQAMKDAWSWEIKKDK